MKNNIDEILDICLAVSIGTALAAMLIVWCST